MSIKLPARFVVMAYLGVAAVGALIGFTICLIAALPSGFAIWLAAGGFVVGAFIGLLALTAGIIAFGLSRRVTDRYAARRSLVSAATGLVTAASIALILFEIKALDPLLYDVMTFIIGSTIAFVAYPFARRCASKAAHNTVAPSAIN